MLSAKDRVILPKWPTSVRGYVVSLNPVSLAIRRGLYYHLIMDLTDLMKALADANRLRILNLLGDETLCVCDLEDVLQLNQSNLSRHLAKLKQVGLVSSRKQGLFSYYSRRALPEPYNRVVEEVCKTLTETNVWAADRLALAAKTSCSPVLLASG